MKPGLVRAALRNYVAAVFFRENPMLISAVSMVLGTMVMFDRATRVVAHGGIRALFMHRSIFVFFWWYVAFYIPACVLFHYWRQVRSNLAMSVPHLKDAEFGAVVIVLVPLICLVASPLILLGAPLPGGIALAAVAMAGGSAMGVAAPTGQSKGLARFRLILFLPLLSAGALPQLLGYILFTPPLPAILIVIVAAGVMVSGLRFYPAQAASQGDLAEQRADRARSSPVRNGIIAQFLRTVGHVITWKPAFVADHPMPTTLGFRLGPIGTILALAAQMAFFLIYMPAFAWLQGQNFTSTLIQTAPQSLAFAIVPTLVGSGQWLINRSDWPCLYMAGRYGGRTGFAGAMADGFRSRTVEFATIGAILLTGVTLALGDIGAANTIPVALCCFGAIFGASYAATLPLLWHELGGKGFTIMFALAGGILTMGILGYGILDHGPKPWAIAAAIAMFGLGLALSRIAPRRLAAMDWPIETESPA